MILRDLLKRLIDLGIGIPLFFLFLPLVLVLLLVVALDSPGNPLFTQTRVGRRGGIFTLYKLRTFYRDRHGVFRNEEIRFGDPRVTRAGQYLRLLKLDELPQLLNVLLGDMSLVGPRPDIPVQARVYGSFESVRLNVRPGLTGLVQISGNTWLRWSERILLDRWYVENQSLRLDLLILLYTLPIVLRGERPTDDPIGIRRLTLFERPAYLKIDGKGDIK